MSASSPYRNTSAINDTAPNESAISEVDTSIVCNSTQVQPLEAKADQSQLSQVVKPLIIDRDEHDPWPASMV